MSACVARPSVQTRIPEPATSNTNQQVSASTKNMPMGIFDEHSEGAKEAWRRFAESGRYRVARAEDFKIPTAAIQNEEIRHDIDRAIKFAYVGEDINRDGLRNDRAFIVVDTKRNDPQKFGLVVFNDEEDKRSVPDPHWVYRDTDLSKTVMFWVSGELTVRNYRDDGSYELCRIKWDERRKQYSCN